MSCHHRSRRQDVHSVRSDRCGLCQQHRRRAATDSHRQRRSNQIRNATSVVWNAFLGWYALLPGPRLLKRCPSNHCAENERRQNQDQRGTDFDIEYSHDKRSHSRNRRIALSLFFLFSFTIFNHPSSIIYATFPFLIPHTYTQAQHAHTYTHINQSISLFLSYYTKILFSIIFWMNRTRKCVRDLHLAKTVTHNFGLHSKTGQLAIYRWLAIVLVLIQWWCRSQDQTTKCT